ncbi:helix-turn-helix transcriptional regulator [bacterium]|nr:helix-turn-helix transcriptional regulator [bacterium]
MEQKFRQQIALNMRIERARKGLTQERLAELSGISAKHITKIEKANVTPSAYLIYKIAKALDVSIDTLTNREI